MARRPVLLLTFVALAGCGGAVPPERIQDLAAAFPLAEVRREAGRVDFGTPAAREHLVAGWYGNERGRGGETFVWSRGDASTLAFHLVAPRPLRATLRGAPLAGGPPQRVTLLVNGRPVAELPLAPGLRDYSVPLPLDLLRAGENRLGFRYAPAPRARQGRGDRRRLAVAWHDLRLSPLPARAAAPRAAARTLLLPWGSEAAYALEVSGEARVALASVETFGRGRGHLSLAGQEEWRQEREISALGAGKRWRAPSLPGEGRRLVRLVFRAVPAEGAPAAGGLRLVAPELRSAAFSVPRPEPPAALPAPALAALHSSSSPPDVLIYLIDALRADRLGAYGGRRGLTPRIDAFAAGGLLFERAVAQAPWTRPAVASVLTGLGPLGHGVTTLDDRLPDAAVTLPERLRAAGYRSAAFSPNLHVAPATGFAQGFDRFELLPVDTSAETLGRRALAWLDAQPPGAPAFVYLHALEPHAPYTPPADLHARFAAGVPAGAGTAAGLAAAYAARGAERARRAAELARLYDAEVAAADRAFGALLDALAARGRLDGALVVLLSDHGEALGERGVLGHAHDLHAEALRIPLVVKLPGQRRGARSRALAQQIDVAPTVLAAAGLAGVPELAGADLARLAAAPAAADRRERPAFSHLRYAGRHAVAVAAGDWKLIQPLPPGAGRPARLYRLDEAWSERRDLAAANPVRRAWLAALVRGELLAARGGLRPEPAAHGEEARRALAALGYR